MERMDDETFASPKSKTCSERSESIQNPKSTSPWPIVGHDWAVDLLRNAVAVGRPAHALLITGLPNVGKGTLARTLAQALLCTETSIPCGACRACRLVVGGSDSASLDRGSHPDVRWVEPLGNSLKIDQVRDLTRQLTLAPLEGKWQIAVLDRFEQATPGAAHALLKTLEEPTAHAILILLAREAEMLLPTIVSRCQVIALRPVPQRIVEQALVERWNVAPDQAHLLSHICAGRLGWAVTASTTPELLRERQQRLDDLSRFMYGARVARFAYAEVLSRQSTTSIGEHLELWAGWWRDVLLLLSNSSSPVTHIDRRDELVRMARQSELADARGALAAILSTWRQLNSNANARLALEALMLRLPFFKSSAGKQTDGE